MDGKITCAEINSDNEKFSNPSEGVVSGDVFPINWIQTMKNMVG